MYSTAVNTHFHNKQINVKTWNPAVEGKNIYINNIISEIELIFNYRTNKVAFLILNYVVEISRFNNSSYADYWDKINIWALSSESFILDSRKKKI